MVEDTLQGALGETIQREIGGVPQASSSIRLAWHSLRTSHWPKQVMGTSPESAREMTVKLLGIEYEYREGRRTGVINTPSFIHG